MRALSLLLGVLLALLPFNALAAEGGSAADASWSTANSIVRSFYLCDGSHAASENCAEFDLNSVGTQSPPQKLGAPETIQFILYRQATNCTPTVSVYGRAVPTATAGATQVDHLIVQLSSAGTSSFSTSVPTLFRAFYATVSADADCTDLEVLINFHYEQ